MKFTSTLWIIALLMISMFCQAQVGSAFFGTGGHQVTLKWTQSIGPGVTGNKVYRSTALGGPYFVVATFNTPVAAYTDASSAVQGGATLYYYVTATCTSCSPTESPNSNTVTVIIPTH